MFSCCYRESHPSLRVPGLIIFLPVIRGPPALVMLNLSFSVGLFFDRFDRPISACVLYTDIL